MTEDQKQPESFSVASAKLAASELWGALSKARKMEYVGNLNEVYVVLDKLASMADVTDKNKSL